MPPVQEKPNQEKFNFRQVSEKEFISFRNRLEKDLFAFLTPHSENDYIENGTKLYLSEDKKSGFGINPDGELISVFALDRQRGKILVAEAKKSGAKYLSCMGDHLFQMYGEFGFVCDNVLKWDNRFAPKDWNYERFGTPNIYDMRLPNKFEKETK